MSIIDYYRRLTPLGDLNIRNKTLAGVDNILTPTSTRNASNLLGVTPEQKDISVGLLDAAPTLGELIQLGSADTQKAPPPQRGILSGLLTGEGTSDRLRGLAAGLLTGAQATPVSFGQSFVKGLLTGDQLSRETEKMRLLKEESEREKRYKEAQIAKLEREALLGDSDSIKLGQAKTVYGPDGQTREVYSKDVNGTRVYYDAQTGSETSLAGYSFTKPEEDKPSTYGQAKPFLNKKTGEIEYLQQVNGIYNKVDEQGTAVAVDLNDYSEPKTPEEKAASAPNFDKIDEYGRVAVDNLNSVYKVDDIIVNLDEAMEKGYFGAKGLFVDILNKAGVALGNDIEDNRRKLRGVLRSGISGQVGSQRVTILGPGVLSERDLDFILNYFGGDFDSIFTNPAIMKDVFSKLREKNVRDYYLGKRRFINTAQDYNALSLIDAYNPVFEQRGRGVSIPPEDWEKEGNSISSWYKLSIPQREELLGL